MEQMLVYSVFTPCLLWLSLCLTFVLHNQRWVGSFFRSSDRPSMSSHTTGGHVTTCWYHSRLFSCVPRGQIIPDFCTHQRLLRSPFADLHTPLYPVGSPESDGEIGLISRVNLYVHKYRNFSGLRVPFWFERSLSKKKKKKKSHLEVLISSCLNQIFSLT